MAAVIYIFLSFLFVFFPLIGFAQPVDFPFVGEVTSDDVNVRAGQSTNFEKVARLNKDDLVFVVEESYGWYKIELPPGADSYISDKYLKPINEIDAEVTGKTVNIRSGADVNRTVLGKVTSGDKVQVLKKVEGWYKIRPVANSYGWMSKEFVKFKTKDTTNYRSLRAISQIVQEEKPSEREPTVNIPPAPVPGEEITLTGVLREKSGEFTLTSDDEKTFHISGPIQSLTYFLNYKVKLIGRVEASSTSSSNLIDITQIHLIY